jgi:hypothetical protein
LRRGPRSLDYWTRLPGGLCRSTKLAKIASQAKDVLNADHLDAVADRGYFNSVKILACEQADITMTLPKPMTSGANADGRFGKTSPICRGKMSIAAQRARS